MLRPCLGCIVPIALLELAFRAPTDRQTVLVAGYFSMRIFEGYLQEMSFFARNRLLF